MPNLIALSLVGGLFSLAGGILLLINPEASKRYLTPLLSFGAGAFLAAAFLDVLPEALEMTDEPHPILAAVLIGFTMFFVVERFIMKYSQRLQGHEHSDHTESLPFLMIIGDSFHNFLDGVVIGLTYMANPLLAVPTTLAIAAHELPQEIGDFAVLLKMKWRRTTIIAVNVAQSLLTIPGVLIGFYLSNILEAYLPVMLGLAGGIFIYISASDLIPEIHHRAGHTQFFRVIIPAIGAMVTIFYLSQLAHG